MGENKHWALIPNYTDPSLMRNTLAYRAAEATGLVSMDTEWVSLVFNGSYAGNYQLCQQIRPGKDRVPVADLEEASRQAAKKVIEAKILPPDKADAVKGRLQDDLSWMSTGIFEFEGQEYAMPETVVRPLLTGGFILEIDEYFDEPSKFTTRMGQPVLFHSPSNAWSNQQLMDYAIGYIQAIEDAVYAEDHRAVYQEVSVHYSDLIDLDSLVKYWLISEFFYNEDLGRKSVFLYKDVGQKVFMGPIWDMDWSSGGSEKTAVWDQWATLSFSELAQENMWYKQLVKDPYFVSRAYQLYHQYRAVFQSIVEDGGQIDRYYEYLYESAQANDALWNTPRTFHQDTMEILKPWLQKRLEWMDRQFLSEETLLSSLNPG